MERIARAHIGSLDIDFHPSESFLGAEGTNIALLLDGPPLPEVLVASMHDNTTGSVKTAYFHFDTGATCVVTDQAAELHCPSPTKATCGTPAKGPRMTINAMGCLVLDFITDKGQPILFEFPHATEIQQFQRQSLSCHALKDLGYDVQHAFLANGNVLHLHKVGSTDWNTIPLVTHG
jgi:hypothetical protein